FLWAGRGADRADPPVVASGTIDAGSRSTAPPTPTPVADAAVPAPTPPPVADDGKPAKPPPAPRPPTPTLTGGQLIELHLKEAKSWSSIDATGILPEVRRMARKLSPDARLVGIDAQCVDPDGRVQLSRCDDGRVIYTFLSPANARRRPKDIGHMVDGETHWGEQYVCAMEIHADSQGLRGWWKTSSVPCSRNSVAARCSAAQVRRKIADLPPTTGVAIPEAASLDANWMELRPGGWQVSIRKGPQSGIWKLPDDC
ncbi:MAG TPA: hypothetical protein VL172_11620, partial [Kofleriaceae bacterium]|nr:hypothetical protein [Kofleriaceae bacterium]